MPPIMIELLTSLCREWEDRYDPTDIRQDIDKVRLLIDAQVNLALMVEYVPDDVKEFYQSVFLRDVWTKDGKPA